MRDVDVRRAVRLQLDAQHADDLDTRIVEEMGVWSGTVRVDIAVINGELSGYELKSNFDTLKRLPRQIEIYGKVFDRMTLVVGDKHAERATSIVPPWWGCVVAAETDSGVALTVKRLGHVNPDPDAAVVVQMLWRHEIVAALDEYGLADGWRSRRSSDLADRLLSNVPLNKLREHVRTALKARDRLGQLSSRKFDMSVDAVADPRGGAPR
jgi:hypothetical protein